MDFKYDENQPELWLDETNFITGDEWVPEMGEKDLRGLEILKSRQYQKSHDSSKLSF